MNPARATNAGNNNYSLTNEALAAIQAHGTTGFDAAVSSFIKQFGGALRRHMPSGGIRTKFRSPFQMAPLCFCRLESTTSSR